jgi:hypothetical protein
MTGQWTFGLSHALTVAGLVITIIIAFLGFFNLGRWRLQRFEEIRIGVALEALAIAHEAEIVFETVRSSLVWGGELGIHGTTIGRDRERSQEAIRAVVRRLDSHQDFFDKAFILETKFVAAFDKRDVFQLLLQARSRLRAVAEALIEEYAIEHDPTDQDTRLRLRRLRANVTATPGEIREYDEVGKLLARFRQRIEEECNPLVARMHRRSKGWFSRWKG